MRPDLLLGGKIDWDGEDLIGAGFIAINPAQKILCRPKHAAALREPRPYGSRGLTRAAAVRDVRVRGLSGASTPLRGA